MLTSRFLFATIIVVCAGACAVAPDPNAAAQLDVQRCRDRGAESVHGALDGPADRSGHLPTYPREQIADGQRFARAYDACLQQVEQDRRAERRETADVDAQ